MRHTRFLPVLLILLCLVVPALAGEREEQVAQIVGNCTEIGGGYLVSRVAATNPDLVPLVWGSPLATGGDKLGLQGTLPVIAWAGQVGKGRVAVWTGHEGFWTSAPDGQGGNDTFRRQLIDWLNPSAQGTAFATAHGEMLNSVKASPLIEAEDVPGALTAASLQGYGLVIIGNTWQEIPESEVDALEEWVREEGGGLLVIGLGWAYAEYNEDPGMHRYAVNVLGERFGWRALSGTINDPLAPNGNGKEPSFKVQSLVDFTPLSVVETGVDDLPAEFADDHIYVVHGEHVAIQLPLESWRAMEDPVAAVEVLDLIYDTQLQLTGGVAPYKGDTQYFISKTDPAGKYYMHSGNPIVMKTEAARKTAELLDKDGVSGWGAAHELGHNMVSSACGNLFTHSGTGEEWCNVYTIWTHEQLGWEYRANAFDEGHAHHAREHPDFADLTSSSWILLGCLELIWSKYGWEGMQAFMSQAAADKASGRKPGNDARRTAYFVEELSRAYEIDFADLIAHWGFPVTAESRGRTAQYPPADIPW